MKWQSCIVFSHWECIFDTLVCMFTANDLLVYSLICQM
uniref:Uncharacterized protein n=1 Tax=Anguilla anguilla TaxID=7936 RepID=A0A0E9VL94_ANGAN